MCDTGDAHNSVILVSDDSSDEGFDAFLEERERVQP